MKNSPSTANSLIRKFPTFEYNSAIEVAKGYSNEDIIEIFTKYLSLNIQSSNKRKNILRSIERNIIKTNHNDIILSKDSLIEDSKLWLTNLTSDFKDFSFNTLRSKRCSSYLRYFLLKEILHIAIEHNLLAEKNIQLVSNVIKQLTDKQNFQESYLYGGKALIQSYLKLPFFKLENKIFICKTLAILGEVDEKTYNKLITSIDNSIEDPYSSNISDHQNKVINRLVIALYAYYLNTSSEKDELESMPIITAEIRNFIYICLQLLPFTIPFEIQSLDNRIITFFQ